jgi:hypothetical protein
MGVGTILLIGVAILIMVIMYRVADGVLGTADANPVAVRDAGTGGEPLLVVAKPDTVDGGATSDRGAPGGRHGCC